MTDIEIPSVTLNDDHIYALIDGLDVDAFLGSLPFIIRYVPSAEVDTQIDTLTGEIVTENVRGTQPSTKERIWPLVVAGYLKEGDVLTYRVNGKIFQAAVKDRGLLETSAGLHWAPSPAATSVRPERLAINGWSSWARSDGKFLADLREESGMWDAIRANKNLVYTLRDDWEQIAKSK